MLRPSYFAGLHCAPLKDIPCFAADRRLGGSGGGCWVLIPKDDASSFCLEDVSHALRSLCEGVVLLSPCD